MTSKEVKDRNRKYYKKNRKTIIKKVKMRQKKTNYAYEKTPEARKRRSIKARTRLNFPLKGMKCQFCPAPATERHHTTDPLIFDWFVFVCHECHVKIHQEKINKFWVKLKSIIRRCTWKEK